SRSTRATSTRTTSPCGWPNVSFTCLKSSMSSMTRPTSLPKRRLRSISESSVSWRWLRVYRPVSSSVTAWSRTVSCRSALAIEPGGERVAHPPDGVLEFAALALDLLDLACQLPRHRVELPAERRELVAALDRNRLAEVTASQAPRGLQELLDLPLKSAHDD